MDQPFPILLENLGRYRREYERARARYRRQLEACIEANYDSPQIAEQLGCKPNNVRSLKAWRERRR